MKPLADGYWLTSLSFSAGSHKSSNMWLARFEAVLKNDLKVQLVTGPAATEVTKCSKSMCKLIPAEAAVEPNPSKRPADVAEDEKEAKRKRALELLGDADDLWSWHAQAVKNMRLRTDLKVRFLVSFWFAHGPMVYQS